MHEMLLYNIIPKVAKLKIVFNGRLFSKHIAYLFTGVMVWTFFHLLYFLVCLCIIRIIRKKSRELKRRPSS